MKKTALLRTTRQIDGKNVLGLAAIAGIVAVGTALSTPAFGQTIVDEWASVKAPPPPELKPVTIDPNPSLTSVETHCAPSIAYAA